MLILLRKSLTALLAIVGAVVTFSEFVGLLNSKDTSEISYYNSEIERFSGTNDLDISVSVSGKSYHGVNSNIYETIITFWNTGDITILDRDIRSPVKISTGSNSDIISIKIIQVKSSVEPNFELKQIDDKAAELRWKIFDPGMAVKVIVLQAGSEKSITIKSDLGSKTTVKKFSNYTARTIVVVSILYLLVMMASIYFLIKSLRFLTPNYNIPMQDRFLYHRYPTTFLFMALFVLSIAAFLSINYAIPQVAMLFSRANSPISLDASLEWKN